MPVYSIEMRSDVHDFIANLPSKAKDKVLFKIDQLEKHGLKLCQLSKGIVEKIGRNLYALRIKTHDFFCRIIFTFCRSVIWLIVAFNKKSNKISEKIIKLALQRQKELNY